MYVGTYLDYKNQKLLVSERVKGKRIIEEYPLILEYYIQDENGYYMGYDNKRLKKITCKNTHELKLHKDNCIKNNIKTYEMNFNLTNKVLYERYKQGETPNLNKSFIDIEVDRKDFEYLTVPELIDKACCPINAVSIYNEWQDTLYTLMLKPENLSKQEAETICNKFESTVLFDDEKALLKGIIFLLDECDVCVGWNSCGFDYPYIVRRIKNLLGEDETKELSPFKVLPVEKEKANDFGGKQTVYDIPGKWFTDYMLLYKKHEQGKKESYSLNSIAELEIGQKKVEHDESLDDMYRQRYEDFIKYNRQDTMLVKRIDDLKRFIEIHNEQAHDIRCNLSDTMGTVAWVDQAIINEAHNENMMIPDRIEGKNSDFEGIVPPGAYCADPVVKGLVSDVFSFDMNSLYPTTKRTLNMSPETIVAQVKLTLTMPYLWQKIRENNLYTNIKNQTPDWGKAWAGMWATLEFDEIQNQTDTILTVKTEEGKEFEATAKDIHDMVWAENSNLCISAFGTIFRTDKVGLVNRILTKWYAERKRLKKLMFNYESMAHGVEIDDELKGMLIEKL